MMRWRKQTGLGPNLFARVLQDILENEGYRLGQLDDRAGIHSNTVSRLQKSLRPHEWSFPVLNPDELERVIYAFQLSDDDVIRLKAAILATAIERMLADRMEKNLALAAAEQILPILERVLYTHAGSRDYLDNIRGDVVEENAHQEKESACAEEKPLDLAHALAYYDQAMLTLLLSKDVETTSEQASLLLQAQSLLKTFLSLLQHLPVSMQQEEEEKRFWYERSIYALEAIKKDDVVQ